MTAVAIVGVQWGDEGKGKVVDCLAGEASIVARFQGGNNAGHTLVVGDSKLVVHLLPSGVLRDGCSSCIGAGVVLDPRVLLHEMEMLASRGYRASLTRLRIDPRAAVILPHHCLIDSLRERQRGADAIGTTGRGIGPCYEDVASRRGVRVADLLDAGALEAAFERLLPEKEALIAWLGGEAPDRMQVLAEYLRYGQALAQYVADVSVLVSEALAADELVLLEGAQGTLLDVSHGTWPFVTSSHTIAGGACAGIGMGPQAIGAVVGIVKAYSTRVGAGPFPTEDEGLAGEHLQRVGAEFGATTGRRRRCGWFDATLVAEAVRLNGITSLALTKLDVLSGLETLRVAVGRQPDGAVIWKEFPGWHDDLQDVRERAHLPENARQYIDALEELVGAPIDLIGVGPGRAQTIGIDALRRRLGLR